MQSHTQSYWSSHVFKGDVWLEAPTLPKEWVLQGAENARVFGDECTGTCRLQIFRICYRRMPRNLWLFVSIAHLLLWFICCTHLLFPIIFKWTQSTFHYMKWLVLQYDCSVCLFWDNCFWKSITRVSESKNYLHNWCSQIAIIYWTKKLNRSASRMKQKGHDLLIANRKKNNTMWASMSWK